MYLLLVFFPLLGSISAGLFGRYIGVKGAQIMTTACLGLSTLLSWYAFMEVGIVGIPFMLIYVLGLILKCYMHLGV